MLAIINLTNGKTTYHFENMVTPYVNEWTCDGYRLSSTAAHNLIDELTAKGFKMVIKEGF